MAPLVLRKYRSSERVELIFENIETLSVQELRENASSKLGIPLDELKLVYSGRVMKTGRSVIDYKVVAGCTIHVMNIKPKKRVESKSRSGQEGLMNNRRVLAMIGRVLGNPAVLQDMMQSTSMEGNSAMLQIFSNPALLASLSDPDNIQEYICNNPEVAAVMEEMIQQYLMSSGSVRDSADEEQLVDMLESHLEEEISQVERGGEEVERVQAQEQMFEHSQALHAHYQQQRQLSHTSSVESSSLQEISYNPQTSQEHGSISVSRQNSSGNSRGITQNQLAVALANAMGSSASSSPRTLSPLASLNLSQVNSSGPSSLSSNQPASLPSSLPSWGNTASLQPDLGRRPGPISAATLQQALNNVSRSSSRPQESVEDGDVELSHRYQLQLDQLHLMGITDDAACLRALSATGGDLQAALEIFYSQ